MEIKVLPRSLKISIAVVICLNIFIFSFLGVSINKKSEDTIENIGSTYMARMNDQVSLHFETIIALRLTMVESIARVAADEEGYGSKEEIEYGARARKFLCAALYSADGEIEMIFGDSVKPNNPGPFLDSLKRGERKVASAVDSSGNEVILFGVPCEYPMSDGSGSLALVVGLSSKYMGEVLFLETENPLIYSFVIRKNGSYVIRDQESVNENYFDRLYRIFDGQNEKADYYIGKLTAAMNASEDYSVILKSGESRRHLYCTSLPYCEWYLVTVLPFAELDQEISGMSSHWLVLVYTASFAVIAMLLYIFLQYFRAFRNQVSELKRMNAEMDAARKAAEQAQKEAEQANAAKQEFLSSMSHDIRTPMNAIIGMTSIAMANTDNPEQVQECLRKIALSSNHLLGLINDVLDMSKIESGKMTLNIMPTSLREVMESIVNIMQPQVKGKNQRFNAVVYEIIAENVCCDSVRLNQVLINLLGNAVKFTPEKGFVQVALYQEALQDPSRVRTHFLVKDTGIGMSEEYQKEVFDSFSREDNARVQKTEGSGLGMAITKYIVDAMGGTISVQSEQGKGTEFHVVFDLEKAKEPEDDTSLPDWNMLVVDDDERSCVNAVRTLKTIGIHSEWCLNAEYAMEMIAERRRRNDDYQIILLNWKLPGMTGIEAAREIRLKYGETSPALLLSACDWSEIEEEARQAGICGFISKPLFRSALLDALKVYAGTPGEKVEKAEETFDLELKGKHILLAEDNELNWEVAKELLSVLEMELDWVENGRSCVEKFENSPVGYYDAIIMDVRMPVMDGYEATRAIRGLERGDADVPVIAMTADAFAEDIQKCLECGMDDHLAKPIDVQVIARKLKKYLKS